MVKSKKENQGEMVKSLDVEKINPPSLAVRKTMSREKLDQLIKSIERVGLLQPIVVKSVRGGRFEIVAGERRWVAHKEMGRATIRALVHKAGVKEYELAKYDENNAREDINPMDEARFISRMHKKFKITQAKLAEHLGRSEAYISQRIGIINAPAIIQDALEDGQITFSVARELAQIDDEQELLHLVTFAVQNGVTPGVAKSWRLQYEARKAAGNIYSTEDHPDKVNIPEVPSSAFICQVCNEQTEINTMRIVKCCPTCENTIRTTS